MVAEECLALSRMAAATTMHVLTGMRVVSWVLNPSGWFPGRSSSRPCDLEGCRAAVWPIITAYRPFLRAPSSSMAADARPPSKDKGHVARRSLLLAEDAEISVMRSSPLFRFGCEIQVGGRRIGQQTLRPFDAVV